MKPLLITTLFLLFSVSLSAQKKKNKYILDIAPNYTFDIKKFKRKATDGIYEFYRPDGLKVEQSKRDDYYWVIIRKEGTPIEKRRYYDLSTGVLRLEANLFYSCTTGFTRQYNESGILIEEIDTDAAFKFSLDDVIKLVKRKFGVDMCLLNDEKSRNKNIYRGDSEYAIFFNTNLINKFPGVGDYIEIEANTGEILYHKKDGIELINKGEPRPIIF